MKKLFYLLFLLPLAFFASCDDDNDMAQVDFNVTLSGVTRVNDNFYTIVGDTVSIDSLTVTSLTDKSASIAGVRYFVDGLPLLGIIEDNQITFAFTTEGMQDGTHVLSITGTVLQVDKSLTSAALNIPLKIVADESALPEGAPEIGTYTATITMDPK